jgi:3-hydroxymyristoyl/3-hydroxydecanoyl-(acyl carrier protein) dehydratase
MRQSLEVRFRADHPTAAGHFPGNPIIPGAVLLDEVLQAIAGESGGVAQSIVRSAKFLEPVRPGTAIVIRWETDSNGQTKFECQSLASERLVAVGTVQLKAAAP